MSGSTVLPTDAVSHLSEADAECEISALDGLDLYGLRRRWQQFGQVPSCLSADLLRRRLAYELQSRARGALKPKTKQRLRQLHEAFKVDPTYVPTISNALLAGTVLVRTWRDTTHKVRVLSDGFEYRGRTYETLSEIAKLITGTKWSGPAFFGFRRGRR